MSTPVTSPAGLALEHTPANAAAVPHGLQCEATALDIHAAVPSWWVELHMNMPGATLFTSAIWMQSWLHHYGKGFTGHWVRWHMNGQTVGGVLVLRRTLWRKGVPLRCLYLNTSEDVDARSPQTEFDQVLHLPHYAAQVCTALVEYLHAQRWDCLLLAGFERTEFFNRMLGMLRYASIETDDKPAPFVNLTTQPPGPYEATLKGKPGAQIRQSIKRYEEVFGPLQLEEAQDEPTRQHYFTEMARLHNAVWRARGIAGAFECSTFMGFHTDLVQQLAVHNGIKLLRARAGEHVLGYVYGLNDRGCNYVYQSGFCYEEDTKLRPGLVTHALAITHCRNQGLHEYDLMAGESQYKRALAQERRDIAWITLHRGTLASRLYIALREAKRRFKPTLPADSTP
jgi:hypothetical protein